MNPSKIVRTVGTALRLRLNDRGFTLVELLIVIALVAVISIPIGASLIFGMNVFKSETQVDRIFQDQQKAFNHIKEALRLDPYDVFIDESGASPVITVGRAPERLKIYQLVDDQLILRQDGTIWVLCDHVTTFAVSDILREDTLEVISFVILIKSEINQRENTLKSELALRRY